MAPDMSFWDTWDNPQSASSAYKIEVRYRYSYVTYAVLLLAIGLMR